MLDRPEGTYSEDEYRFHWKQLGVEMVLERFVESKDDIRCELTVHYDHPTRGGKLYSGRLLLIGPNSLRDVGGALTKADPEFDFWQPMLQQARDMAKDRFRTGEPSTDLRIDTNQSVSRYMVRPFILDRGITVFFGSEESAKSLFQMVLAVVIASGEEIAGIAAEETGVVGYLDWEDDAGVHQERLKAICAGAGIDIASVHIEHKRMVASLAESARELKQWVATINARYIIADSLGMACGGDPNDPALMIKTMIAARALNVPIGAIHHLAKDAKDKSRPYGTVYAAAEARMTWLVEKDGESSPGKLRVALTNKKSNRTQRHPRQSFEISFTTNPDTEELLQVDVKPLSFSDAADVGTGAGQKWRIAAVLKNGPKGLDDISAAAGIPKASCRMQLNRHKGTLFAKGIDDRWSIIASTEEGPVSDTYHPVSDTSGESYQGGTLSPPDTRYISGKSGEEEQPW